MLWIIIWAAALVWLSFGYVAAKAFYRTSGKAASIIPCLIFGVIAYMCAWSDAKRAMESIHGGDNNFIRIATIKFLGEEVR
jgi:hypothetical protein